MVKGSTVAKTIFFALIAFVIIGILLVIFGYSNPIALGIGIGLTMIGGSLLLIWILFWAQHPRRGKFWG